MGNIFQCCLTLSKFLKCQDPPALGGAEQSPLLSSDESECESPSPPYALEDGPLTVSSGITNPALEPEHFLFPDIILSSNPGGEVTLVEPMVCLLVSEEDEGPKPGEPGVEPQEMGYGEGRGRSYSEVETQTEAETHIGMAVQTQTEAQAEVQTQTETLKCSDETVEWDMSTFTNTGINNEIDAWEEEVRQLDVFLEAQRERQTSQNEQKEKTNMSSAGRADVEGSADGVLRGIVGEKSNTLGNPFLQIQSNPLQEELNPDEDDMFGLQESVVTAEIHHPAPTHLEENSELTSSLLDEQKQSSVDDHITTLEPHRVTRHSSAGIMNLNPAGRCKDMEPQSNEDGGQAEETSILTSDVTVKDNDNIQADQIADLSILNTDLVQCWENSHPTKRDGDYNTTGLQKGLEKEASSPLVEEEAEKTQMTLFLVDRLFLAAPHGKVSPCLTVDIPEEDLQQLPDDEERKQASLQDVVDLHESAFTVRIQPPGTESFELQVSGQMLVAELQQLLMDHELTCQCTCFSLQLGSATLDGLAELSSIQGAQGVQGVQDGVLIKVVEDAYSVRDARLHLRHVRELLRSLDPTDAYNGVNGSSLSYLSLYTRGPKDGESLGKKRACEKEWVDCSLPEYVLPGSKERPLMPLQPVRDDWTPLQCLRVLSLSSWNPPPGNRKMHGDLLYINVMTLEDKELNITSSTRGFYLNQSTAFNFNPKPAVPKILCHSLVELLSQVSPAFKKNFNTLQKRRVQLHPYERVPAPFQVFTWIAPHGDHTLDWVRAEETHTSYMGQDEHTAGQSRDWNEELQACRELPRNSLQERLHRQRSIFKTNSDFVAAAAQGAVAVIDGNVVPLNPGEPPHLHMFMWSNLFFSQGFDMSDHYRSLGGNTAAHAAATCDLRGVQAYTSVDTEGLHTLGTAVVDYRGVRVIAQTVVPGILEKNHEQIVYGSNDNGKTVFTHPRFLELLDKTSKPLRIQRHQVLDHHDGPLELCSGLSTIGIFGNDRRPYILDLLRTFPPDLNFQFSETADPTEEVPAACRGSGYPRPHRHCLASLRPELMEAFVQHRYECFVKMVSQGLGQLDRREEATEQNEEPVCETRAGDDAAVSGDTEIQKQKVILEACKAVGSVSDSCFDIRFNPDVCSPGVRFPSECMEELQRHRRLLWDAAAFLLSNQIPAMLRDCLEHTAELMDGATLTSLLHQWGVNVRYLGSVLGELGKMEEKGRLGHLQRISISEVIIRSAKHILRTYLQDVKPAAFSAAVSHFLNCLLSSSSCFPGSCSDELLSHRRSRRRRSHGSRAGLLSDSVWARLTSGELWSRVRAEARDYYCCTIDSESIDEVIDKYGLQKISLLREIAMTTGIQVRLREYVFESRQRPVFGEEDVINMFPVVKHIKPTSADATRLVQRAQLAVQQGLLREGHDFINQALTLFSSICGVLHEDVCTCLRLLGRISYVLGENADALSYQEKAVMSSERLLGIDHPQTVQDYTYLALYCFAGGHHSASLQMLYRARYLTLVVSGDDHPQLALLDSMLGLVLHGLMKYELSLKFLQNALFLTSKYHGATALKHAHSHHLLATVYESKGEFRSALQHEKEAYSIYKIQVGENHDSAKESSEYLKSLTQQAVILQKALNHIYSDAPSACIPPPKFSTPSLAIILQQLNVTCGIIFIPVSAKELSDLRTQLKGHEQVKGEALEDQLLKQKGWRTGECRQQH
ncbi:clustered mitochondria protein homolog [Cololabis saira]|uniref:clustered mitochondria protein homolog n=1 Tax=Cololabis saira TaxID=129043 RepID=UPI002AD2C7C5|nr:clustered mitochondria protein homolog [Cololabis saira]XP_061595698.1 clustered mitochondria protein homolog [Cololabis saira]XP_061595699.1 clustered mitochondria protein homolog [Cololabis saira]XP_061595700.1 clustered mitochondria protein homolog [Cololabis saira]